MTDEPRGALVAELRVHRVKVRLPLSADEVRDYLEADDRDEWVDEYLERNGDRPEIERVLSEAYEFRKVEYDGPDSTDSLPPRVHKDQMTIEIPA